MVIFFIVLFVAAFILLSIDRFEQAGAVEVCNNVGHQWEDGDVHGAQYVCARCGLMF